MKHSRQNLNKLVFIWAALAMLNIGIPFASAAHSISGHSVNLVTGAAVAPLTTLAIEADVPEYSREATLDITGRTKPLASVHGFVNTVRHRVYTTKADGVFVLLNLPLTEGTNTVRLEAHEGTNTVSKDYIVTYDGTPPVVILDKELPKATTANSITVTGDVNEKVTIYYRVLHRKDNSAPALVSGLKAQKIEAQAVELVWEPNGAADLKEYLIERNGKRIATTALTSFRDEPLQPNKAYAYSVSAVDDSCNVGTSADITVNTKLGGTNVTMAVPAAINLSCETPYQTMTAGSPFSLTLPLTQGTNDVEIIFEDRAGNREVVAQTILSDTIGPKFLETNLKDLTPAYAPDITIKGKLDEQATVFVYVNDEKKPSEFEVTSADGTFSIRTHLRTDVRIKKGAAKAGIETGDGWVNKIRLEAVDLAGNKATFGPTDIDFLLCGSGTWWNANLGEALPTILLPRLMLQGVQQIGIPFNLTYIGTQQNVKIGKIDVRPIPLSAESRKDYDHDWIQVQEYTRPKGPKNVLGYIQVNFENVDPLPDNPAAGPHEKERALSGHRRGTCIAQHAGCVKLFLQMEVTFQEIIPLRPTDPNMPISTPQIEKKTQRTCIPVEVAIDQVIPTDIIPKTLLRNALSLIDNALGLIDKVLAPLTTIGEYVLYGCLASNVWLFVDFAQEKWNCDASAITGKFNKGVAEAGLCDEVYGAPAGSTPSTEKAQQQQKCRKCENTIASRKKFEENVMHGLCDRIGCPSAPTFSSYIRSKAGRADPLPMQGDITPESALYKWALPGKGGKQAVFVGNDCAFTTREANLISPTYYAHMQFADVTLSGAGPGGLLPVTAAMPIGEKRLGIRDLFDIAKGKDAKDLALPTQYSKGPTAKECKDVLHPAHPNCCGVQYQRDWSSSCGTGTVLGGALDFFDELKESTCLAAQQANIPAKDLNCNRLWNSIAGFCEKNTGQPTFQPFSLDASWGDRAGKPRPGADGNQGFLFVFPVEPSQPSTLGVPTAQIGLGGTGTARAYQVWAGYIQSGYTAAPNTGKAEAFLGYPPKVTVGETKATEALIDVTECFGQKPQEGKPRMEFNNQVSCVQNKVCTELPKEDAPYKLQPCEAGNIRRTVQKVNEYIMIPDQQYIVKPNSGFLRSIQCGCIPAVTSYLHLWQRVLGAFHKCFSKILLTGEGSEGACAAALSAPICDLLFEFISCFVQKFDLAGDGSRAETGGFSNILGVLTGAGTSVSKSVTERYGDTPLYKSLFSERKLVHAICNWAFTGTWDLNIENLFQQQVEEIPIETEALLSTCERTFIAYDPTTTPSGLTTWAYRIGGALVAGSDVQYRLKLKCSEGFTCDSRDYADGKCDCFAQARSVYVSDVALGPGRARKYDVVSFDAPFVIQAQRSPDSDVRYDTALLEWTWTDLQTKQVVTKTVDCRIRETDGGHALPFCAIDVFSGKFRCLFGEQDSGIRIVSASATYPEKQDAFGLGQHMNFTLDIKQQFPPERPLQHAAQKFLTYEIKGTTGDVVKRDDGVPLRLEPDAVSAQYMLGTDGTYRFIVPQSPDETPLARFVLSEDRINLYSKSAAAAVPLQQTWPVSVAGLVSRVSVSTPAGLASPEKMWFLIDFPKFGEENKGEENFDVYRITAPGSKFPAKDATSGWTNLPKSTIFFSGKQDPNRPMNSAKFRLGTEGPFVEIEFRKLQGYTANEVQILVEYTPPLAAPQATTACSTKQPVRWTATFTIYDADRQGNPTEQISTDPETGDIQQKTVEFYVRCITGEEIRTETEKKEAEAKALKPVPTTTPKPITLPAPPSEAELNNLNPGSQVLLMHPDGTQLTFQKHTDNTWRMIASKKPGQPVQQVDPAIQEPLTPAQLLAMAGTKYVWQITAVPLIPPTPTITGKPCKELGGECLTGGVDECETRGGQPIQTGVSDCENRCCKLPFIPTEADLQTKLTGTALSVIEAGTENQYYLEKTTRGSWEEMGIYTSDEQWHVLPVSQSVERSSSEVIDFFAGASQWMFAPPIKNALDMKPNGQILVITSQGVQTKYKKADTKWDRIASKHVKGATFTPITPVTAFDAALLVDTEQDSVWQFTGVEPLLTTAQQQAVRELETNPVGAVLVITEPNGNQHYYEKVGSIAWKYLWFKEPSTQWTVKSATVSPKDIVLLFPTASHSFAVPHRIMLDSKIVTKLNQQLIITDTAGMQMKYQQRSIDQKWDRIASKHVNDATFTPITPVTVFDAALLVNAEQDSVWQFLE